MEEEKPYGTWLRATGRRPQTSIGQRWLVPDNPSHSEPPRMAVQEVEMSESETDKGSEHGEPEASRIQTSSSHSVLTSGVNEANKTTKLTTASQSNMGNSVDSHGPTQNVSNQILTGSCNSDQKRRRKDLGSINYDVDDCFIDEDSSELNIPKNLSMAGPGSQACPEK